MSYFGPFAILVRDIVLYKSKGTGGGVVTTTPSEVPANAIVSNITSDEIVSNVTSDYITGNV